MDDLEVVGDGQVIQNNASIEKYRFRSGPLGSDASYGNNGVFIIRHGAIPIIVQASDGAGWEHISVSLETRCPVWPEMCFIKDLFWAEDEVVIQYHPAKRDYVNNHAFCLHLWKPIGVELPQPPTNLVGIK